ncbi:hypothetical protein [Salegentibacter sp. F14]
MSDFLKKLIFPVTPLVVIAALGILYTIYILFIVFNSEAEAALIGAVIGAITLIILVFYIIDRILISIIPYKVIAIGELVLGILIAVSITRNESTIDIQITTDKNYIVILFDSDENALTDYKTNGIYGKKISVTNHIIHLDSNLYNNESLRINTPEWSGFIQEEGTIRLNNKTVKYILRTHGTKNPHGFYIDSLIQEIEKE